jgi:hypothetical protein
MRDDPRSSGDRIRKRWRELGLSQRDLSRPGISYAYREPHRIRSAAAVAEDAPELAPKLETGVPDPADELAVLVLEYGRRPLPRRATQRARKVLGESASASSS